jgi:hypothetical protein
MSSEVNLWIASLVSAGWILVFFLVGALMGARTAKNFNGASLLGSLSSSASIMGLQKWGLSPLLLYFLFVSYWLGWVVGYNVSSDESNWAQLHLRHSGIRRETIRRGVARETR